MFYITEKTLPLILMVTIFLNGCQDAKNTSSNKQDFNPSWHNLKNSQTADTDGNVAGDTPRPSGPDITSTGYTGDQNPLMSLELTSADQIDQEKALLIMDGLGLMGSNSVHKLSFNSAMSALCIGATGKAQSSLKSTYSGPDGWGCQGVSLDSKVANGVGGRNNFRADPETSRTMREVLFNQYKLAREALLKYKDYPTISMTATPKLFDSLLRNSADGLTNVPSAQRLKLMQSLMISESGKTHWKNYRPVASHTGAFGIGQFLPSTAKSIGINPYDPEQNIKGIALYLNQLIKQKGSLRDALKAYNGSGPETNGYADGILARL